MVSLDESVDWKERIKALQGQIDELKRQERAEQMERRKALEDQIAAIRQQQKEVQNEVQKERKKGLRMHFALKLGEGCDRPLMGGNTKDLEFLQDREDTDVRKGFLKLHILDVLADRPSHGYEIMHRISHHTGHLWTPSPGSMYPALETLESKGFISCQGDGRRKVYSLTPKGEDVLARTKKKREEQFSEMKAFMAALFDE